MPLRFETRPGTIPYRFCIKRHGAALLWTNVVIPSEEGNAGQRKTILGGLFGKLKSPLTPTKSRCVPLGISSCGEILSSSNAVSCQLTFLQALYIAMSIADSDALNQIESTIIASTRYSNMIAAIRKPSGIMGRLQCDTAWRCVTSEPTFGSRSPNANFRAFGGTT